MTRLFCRKKDFENYISEAYEQDKRDGTPLTFNSITPPMSHTTPVTPGI